MSNAIKIVGMDERRTAAVADGSAMYNIYLPLSSRPSADWGRIFAERRKFPRHSMWRHAWLEGDCIVVQCPLDELKVHHLADLKDDVAFANENVAAVDAQRARAAEEYQKAQAAERERVARLKGDLDFS